MRKLNKLGMLAALMLCAGGLQACFVDTNCVEKSYLDCQRVCTDHVYTECDPFWGCVDHVYTDCADHCDRVYYCDYYDSNDHHDNHSDGFYCRHNYDCAGGQYCENGKCNDYSSGTAQMCQSCKRSADCWGSDSACVKMGSGEQVCLQGCQAASDCSMGFECMVVDDLVNHQSIQQCVPQTQSCDPDYCDDRYLCAENAECVNNRCVHDVLDVNECSTFEDCFAYDMDVCVKTTVENKDISYCSLTCYSDWQCPVGYSCILTEPNNLESGVCFKYGGDECVYSTDCSDGMVCSDGKCSKACSNDIECASPSNGYACVTGVCKFMK